MLEAGEILFLGVGNSSIFWYRCALPALHIGADWVGIQGRPPQMQVVTGLVRGQTSLPRWGDYKLVVIQQPFGRSWLTTIKHLRGRGIKVLYEIDDYLHGVSKQLSHDYRHGFTKKAVREYELCMRACDGLIVSTPYLARRYAKFNPNVYLARNGLDVARYDLTRPKREIVNIGWAGASGHIAALLPWLNELLPSMQKRSDLGLVCIGQPRVAQAASEIIGDRSIPVPFTTLEAYPAAMCLLDIALAPSQDTAWYRAKSDLRWLEASALGIPVVADPLVYPDIEHGVTGFWARTPAEMRKIVLELADDRELRERVGRAAREHVLSERSIEGLAPQWYEIACAVVGGYESALQTHRAQRGGSK